GQDVEWSAASAFRPFCSKRCQLIDLGEWADEEKRIPGPDDLSDGESWSEQE
ncbi:MAG: DNA gyrase inhibitor YacG, partial [Plesiomonas shigelloides]